MPEHLPERDATLDELLQRRVPVRVRVVQGLGLLVLGAVGAGLLAHALLPALGAIPGPSPTPVALGPVLVRSNVSSGAVTLDGRPLVGSLPLVTTFHRGQNTLTLTAPSFRPLTCPVPWPSAPQLLWPSGPSGQGQPSCDLNRDVRPIHVGGRPVTPVAIVDFWVSGEDLPPAERARALANVTTPLRAVPLRTQVPVGDYFATGRDAQGQIRSQRAAVPLQADELVTPTDLVYGGDPFCTDASDVPSGCLLSPTPSTEPSTQGQIGPAWAVRADVALQWRFTSGDGPVYQSAPDRGGDPRLVLTYDARVGWVVDPSATERMNGFGLPAAVTLATQGVVPTLFGTFAYQHGYVIAIPHDHGIEGAELQLQAAGGTPAGSFVWRFGVLLAADAQAHALLPDLSMAPPSELSAVVAS